MDWQFGYCSKAWQDKNLLRSSGLRQSLEKPKYQMLTLEEILPHLAKAKLFSTLVFTRSALTREVVWKLHSGPLNLHERLDDLLGVVVLWDDVLVMGYQDLKPDRAKVDAIKGLKEMPRPACKKEVATLLSFMIYMSTFLPRLTEVTQPLCELTTKVAQFIDIE